MLGPVRVSSREIGGLRTVLVDLDRDTAPATAARELCREFRETDDADHVAWRGGQRFTRTRSTIVASRPTQLPRRLVDGGVYVVTGGTGGLGRQIALWLAKRAKARVVLMSRQAKQDADLQAAAGESGGQLSIIAADVTSRESLSAALEEVRAQYGRINGAIHAAGVLNDGLLSAKSLKDAEDVMAPKIIGGQNLLELLPEGSVDFISFFSSTSVVLGSPGQTDYVAANAWLEAAATSRGDTFSVAWGIWSDTGMAARLYGTAETASSDWRRLEEGSGTTRFELAIDPASDWVVREHIVAGVPVLPGMGYLDLVFRAAIDVHGERPVSLDDVSFVSSMLFPEGLPRRLTLQWTPESARLRRDDRECAGIRSIRDRARSFVRKYRRAFHRTHQSNRHGLP